MSEAENKDIQTNSNTKRKGGTKAILIIALIVVIVVLVGVIVWLVTRGEDEEKRNVVVTPDNVDEVIEQMSEAKYTEPGYYEVSMTNEWHFANGGAVSEDAYVENVANNTNDVYFDVVLAEDEDNVIYKSPVIPRGSSLEEIALDKELEAGVYDCVMIYHLVDEDQNTISTLRVTVTITIEG